MQTHQEKIALVNDIESNHLDYALRNNKINPEVEQALIRDIAAAARGEKKLDQPIHLSLANSYYYSIRSLLGSIINNPDFLSMWSEKDSWIQEIFNSQTIKNPNLYYQWRLIMKVFFQPAGSPGFENWLEYIQSIGLTDEELTLKLGAVNHQAFQTQNADKEIVNTCFAEYIIPKLKSSSSYLGLKKTAGLGSVLHRITTQDQHRRGHNGILTFLLKHDQDSIDDYQPYITNVTYNNQAELNIEGIKTLLGHDAHQFEDLVLEQTRKFENPRDQFSLYLNLAESFPEKYHSNIEAIGESELNKYCGAEPNKNQHLSYDYVHGGSMDVVYCKYLLAKDPIKAKDRILEYTKDSHYITTSLFRLIQKDLESDALPYLLNCLSKKSTLVDVRYRSYFKQLFDILNKYDLSKHTDYLIDFGTRSTAKKHRLFASDALKPYIESITPQAQQLLEGKVNDRIFGAMILQHSTDQAVIDQLNTLIDTERSDDTRDIMLDALHDAKFGTPLTQTEVNDMIAKADARKKLNKWSEKWIDESTLPKLYWAKGGGALNEKEIRFLFYRCRRVKGINSDIEAKQLIDLLDFKKTEKFALALVKAYEESNADSKYKYYLVMAGLIGKDAILTKLNTVFKSTVTNKRYRMAGMIVGAIAMVGSDKALRIVDMIARKFANKRPQIGKGAKEALDAAANELGITMDQLGDRIIPDFGFEDHYYSFDAGGDDYRAFINKEFKLNYFNEDNKLRKSMPKEISKEDKAELKAIEKELKVIVKAQQGRLEGYLATERSWEVEEWMEYYLSNPVMLIYVQKLIWGVYDEEHNLTQVFYCDDDLELYDVDDEEVDIEEGTYIKIVHPLHMSDYLLSKWKDKVYDMEMNFEFEVINRVVTHIPEEEYEGSVSKILFDQEIPKGADYVAGFLVKRGWVKSTGDGGYLQFNKVSEAAKVNVYANIEGPAAYYQGGTTQAKVYELNFSEHGTRQRKLLSDVPKVFYSEVVADLKALINA